MSLLEGKNVFLRAIEPADIDLLYKWENNTNIWRISNTLTPFSKKTLKTYIENSASDIFTAKQVRFIICKHSSEEIGTIDLFDFEPFHQRAGIGILITEEERNKGFAGEALGLLCDYAFNHLQLNQLYCNIDTDNRNSIQLFKKQGFIITGEKQKWNRTVNGWKNEYFLQLIRQS